ncbi:MAG: thiamine diphosphokinase [Coriobacteriia bacterium]
MGALVIAGAPVHDREAYRPILESAGVRIAVDGGADLCLALGWMPDLFVGDGDSVSDASMRQVVAAGVPTIMLSRDKDVTDLEVALQTASDRFPEGVRVTAVMGGRTDHLLVALGDLFACTARSVSVVEPTEKAWFLSPATTDTLTIAPTGSVVSVIAGPTGAIVSLSGFRWELDRVELRALSGQGLSNVIANDVAVVKVHRGSVLVHAPAPDASPAVYAVM